MQDLFKCRLVSARISRLLRLFFSFFFKAKTDQMRLYPGHMKEKKNSMSP